MLFFFPSLFSFLPNYFQLSQYCSKVQYPPNPFEFFPLFFFFSSRSFLSRSLSFMLITRWSYRYFIFSFTLILKCLDFATASLIMCCCSMSDFSFNHCPVLLVHLLPSLGVRRLSSVNFSHFKLLLRNHLADWNRT